MNESLLHRMRPVARRFRRLRFWQSWVLIVGGALLAALWLRSRAGVGGVDGRSAAITLSYVIAGAAIVAAILCSFLYRDPNRIAREIENRFPSLDQRLFTALSQRGDQIGYLQQRVVKEARDHSRSHQWTDAVSSRSLWLSRLSGLAGTAMLAIVLGLLAVTVPDRQSVGFASRRSIDVPIVEPGDIAIERGTSLVVTARFSEAIVNNGELWCEDDAEERRTLPMTQTLDDPILGGFVSSVDRSMTYQVHTAYWTSRKFKVDVFEYPEMQRADAQLVYPDYTHLDPKLIEDTLRVSAVVGTRATWQLTLNKTVASADLIDEAGERTSIQFESDSATVGEAEFLIDQNRRFELELVDHQGRKNKYSTQLVMRALPNKPPTLKVTPAKDSSVSPLEELSISADVADDFGVAEIGLAYSIDGAEPTEIILQRDIEAGAKTTVQHLVALEDLHAKPDQLFAYHFFAIDAGVDGEPRRTDSDMYFADVRPFEEIFREGQPPAGGEGPPPSGNANESDELAELQKEIINATWRVIRDRRLKKSDDPRKNEEEIGLLIESQSDAIKKLDALAAKIRDPQSQSFVVETRASMNMAIEQLDDASEISSENDLSSALPPEQAAYGGLLKLRAREFEVSKSQQQSKSQSSASQQRKQKQLDELELEQDENRYETQSKAQAASPEEEAAQEVRQLLSRLRDLARRQEDLNIELAQLQSALEQAKTEQEREEIERQLKRLRDQQQDLLRETDELAERMQNPSSQSVDQETQQKLDETRKDVQNAAEALNQNDASKALTSGKRAERQFEEMRDELRKASAGQFNEAMRELRNESQKLDEQQQALQQKMDSDPTSEPTAGLRGDTKPRDIEKELTEQKEALEGLLERMQDVVTEAEESEPLLAQKLYDSYRKASQRGVAKKLDDAGQWIKRGLKSQAKQLTEEAGEGVGQLRSEVEQAADSVLGDETKALARAAGELERLDQQLQAELDANRAESPNSSNENPSPKDGNPSNEGTPSNEGAPSKDGEAQQGRPGQGEGESSNDSEEQQQGPGKGSGSGKQSEPGTASGESAMSGFAGGGRAAAAPLTGDGYREWSDSLREVEEMVDDSAIRSQAAQIRDRARDIRTEFLRHSKEPEWELVDEMIATPLRELKRNVAEELLRRSAEKNASVPIDRDPVPRQYSEAVERYYERLGSDD